MGRPRKRDRDLPQRVYIRSGTYYYARPDGRWQNLGRDYRTAMAQLSVAADRDGVHTFADLAERYRRRVLPTKAERTRRDQSAQLDRLAQVFGAMLPADISAPMVAEYRDRRYQRSVTQANQELALLSHVMRYAVEWGAAQFNPVRDVKRRTVRPRDRYVSDDDYKRVRDAAPEWLRRAMSLAVLTGQRLGDLRALTWDQVTPAGIEFRQGKTGQRLVIEWSPALRQAVGKAGRPSDPVLVAARGLPITQAALSSGWRRAIAKATQDGLQRPFTFHDLRAKSASDSLPEAARVRLGHRSMATTERIYRRAVRTAKPGRLPA